MGALESGGGGGRGLTQGVQVVKRLKPAGRRVGLVEIRTTFRRFLENTAEEEGA